MYVVNELDAVGDTSRHMAASRCHCPRAETEVSQRCRTKQEPGPRFAIANAPLNRNRISLLSISDLRGPPRG